MEVNSMHVANLELCRELYGVSGWNDTEFYFNAGGQRWYLKPSRRKSNPISGNETPAYDLGYLLRKLPPLIRIPYKNGRLRKHPNFLSLRPTRNYSDSRTFVQKWEAIYLKWHANDYIMATADTPEDAAAKLAIELFRQGVLTKLEVAGSDE